MKITINLDTNLDEIKVEIEPTELIDQLIN